MTFVVMELEFGIKNFRVFDKDGSTFNLKPITLLTGANCAGKSTLVKAIMLLKQYYDKGAIKYNLDAPGAVDISFEEESININGIDSVVNNKSGDYKDVVFTLTKPSITKNVRYSIEYTFTSREGDYFNNGWLKRLRFSCIINDNPETFIDVTYEDGVEDFKVINIGGNILQSFLREKKLKHYYRLREVDPDYEPGTDLFNAAKRGFTELISQIRSNPLNKTLSFYSEPKVLDENSPCAVDIMPSDESNSLSSALHESFKEWERSLPNYLLFHESGILLSFPILSRIGKMNCDDLGEYLMDDERLSQVADLTKDPDSKPTERKKAAITKRERIYLDSFQEVFDKIAGEFGINGTRHSLFFHYKERVIQMLDDFKNAPYQRFEDYYRFKERQFLDNLLILKRDFRHPVDTKFTNILWWVIIEPLSSPAVLSEPQLNFQDSSSFALIYNIILLNQMADKDKDSALFKEYESVSRSLDIVDSNDTFVLPPLFDSYRRYIIQIVQSLLQIKDFRYVSVNNSFLCPIQRSYSIYDKTNALSRLLVSYIAAKERFAHDNSGRTIGFIDKWVQELGIGESVVFELNKEKTDIKVLIKNDQGELVSSADLGHGVTQLLSILINIEWQIYEKISFTDIRTITFEEPEISLHPCWQSALGRIFYDAATNYSIHFIIETHSEYLIRATQAIVANTVNNESELNSIPFRVYYIENGGKAYDMEYQVSGRFKKPFGTGFFDEAGKSSLEIIRKERRMADGKDA